MGRKPAQDFHLRHESDAPLDIEDVEIRFEECIAAVLAGRAESDGLNRLILSAHLDWRETSLLRCYTKYLLQLGMPFSQDYMEDVLVVHASFVRLLIDQFKFQFDPELSKSAREKKLDLLLPKVQRRINKAKKCRRRLNTQISQTSGVAMAPRAEPLSSV